MPVLSRLEAEREKEGVEVGMTNDDAQQQTCVMLGRTGAEALSTQGGCSMSASLTKRVVSISFYYHY